MYLGHSPCHADTVALVLNPKTLHVSPQFHVAFNNQFNTVPYLATGDVPPTWNEIVGKSERISQNDCDLAKLWINSKESINEDMPNQEGEPTTSSTSRQYVPVSEGGLMKEKTLVPEEEDNKQEVMNPEGDSKNVSLLLQPTLPDLDALSCRRSARVPQPLEKALERNDVSVRRLFGLATASKSKDRNTEKFNCLKALETHFHNINTIFDGTINQCHHLILVT